MLTAIFSEVSAKHSNAVLKRSIGGVPCGPYRVLGRGLRRYRSGERVRVRACVPAQIYFKELTYTLRGLATLTPTGHAGRLELSCRS